MKVEDWDKYYREEDLESMPWYHDELDPDLEVALKKLKVDSGKVLDLGTGPGTQAMALASRGFTVTATDVSPNAVKKAKEKAGEEGLDNIDFLADDILSTSLSGEFDLVFDRGCFHVLDPEKRPEYVSTVSELVRPGGYLFLKVFSHLEKDMVGGPYRFTPGDIYEMFSPKFSIYSIDETIYHGTLEPEPLALFCVLRKPMKKKPG